MYACSVPTASSSSACLHLAHTQAVDRLRSFLQKYVEVLDPGTTIGLLAGYGRLDELMHYARCRGDWESLLEYLLQRQEVGAGASCTELQQLARIMAPQSRQHCSTCQPEAASPSTHTCVASSCQLFFLAGGAGT